MKSSKDVSCLLSTPRMNIIGCRFPDSFKTWRNCMRKGWLYVPQAHHLHRPGSHLWSPPPPADSWHYCWWKTETRPILNWITHSHSKPSWVLFLAPISFWSEESCRRELHLPSPWQNSLWILYFLWEVLFNNSKVKCHPLTPPAPAPATLPKFDTLFDWFAFLLNWMPGSKLKETYVAFLPIRQPPFTKGEIHCMGFSLRWIWVTFYQPGKQNLREPTWVSFLVKTPIHHSWMDRSK